MGEGSGVEAEVRQQLEEQAVERHAQDLFHTQLRAAAHLRHLRLLPRQQEQRLRRLQGRRQLFRLRHAVSDQRADSGERSTGRVLARRTSESLQPAAGIDDERVLQGRSDYMHQLPRRPWIAQRAFAEGEHLPGPQRRRAVHAMPYRAEGPHALKPSSPQALVYGPGAGGSYVSQGRLGGLTLYQLSY